MLWGWILLAAFLLLSVTVVFIIKLFTPGPLLNRKPKVDLQHQSKETVTEEGPNQAPIRVYNPVKPIVSYFGENIKTIYDLFNVASSTHGSRRCLGTRSFQADGERGHYQWKTYSEINARAENLASGLVLLGAKPHDCIGIYSKNREEWIITEQACYKQNLCIVSFYDTLGANAVEYIANHSETKIAVCSGESFPKMVQAAVNCPALKHIIIMEGVSDKEEAEKAKVNSSVILHSFTDVELKGKKSPQELNVPKPSDLSTIMYTSGTTGEPKGVMITHENVISVLASVSGSIPSVSQEDCYLSYLPLAHIFERAVITLCLGRGSRIGFYQGDIRKLTADLKELRPTIFAGVPRVFDRVYDAILAGIKKKGALVQKMFQIAYKVKREALLQGRGTPLWDMIMFSNFKSVIGGRIRFIITGSAPLSPAVHEFMRICLCCPVMQGYGLTETTAGATISDPADPIVGHCGPPVPGVEIKLVDVPDMEYFSTDKPCPRGEILLRGKCITKGYYKNPEKTAEDYEGGWFHTGDIGMWTKEGTLKIIDRKKNLFKLAQGEYISPEKLESAMQRSRYVAQVWVYGESSKASLVGVCVPEKEPALKWASENNKPASFESLCRDSDFNKLILQELENEAKNAKLHRFEFVQRVHLHPHEFSTENDLMTPSFKLRRPYLKKYFHSELEKLYNGLP